LVLKRFSCRTHGGIFTKQAARGRQPVRCTEEYPCDKSDRQAGNLANTVRDARGVDRVVATATVAAAESNGKAPTLDNPSLPLAMAAKERLVAAGWICKGKGSGTMAELIASRQAETLIIRWADGQLISQDYAMEFERPDDNGYPPHRLHFDPDELSDRELIDQIRGMKVTWWNTIAHAEQSAIIGNKVAIEHLFNDDSNDKRIVKFIDHGGQGFKAFHVSALQRVG
jgi:hypothetical protein